MPNCVFRVRHRALWTRRASRGRTGRRSRAAAQDTYPRLPLFFRSKFLKRAHFLRLLKTEEEDEAYALEGGDTLEESLHRAHALFKASDLACRERRVSGEEAYLSLSLSVSIDRPFSIATRGDLETLSIRQKSGEKPDVKVNVSFERSSLCRNLSKSLSTFFREKTRLI